MITCEQELLYAFARFVSFAQITCYLYMPFLLQRTHRSDNLTLNMSNDAVLHKEVPFWG